MKERVGRRNFQIWAYDVESHNDDESIMKKRTSIWLSSFINEDSQMDDESNFFYTIDSWLDKLEELTHPAKRTRKQPKTYCNNICIYVWNFAFEWSFILPALLKRGFEFKAAIEKGDSKKFTSISTKTCSSVWQATFKFGKSDGFIVIKDLMKIFPGSLRGVAKSFGLATQKGEIDYRLNRLHGHRVTLKEKRYCFKDTRIIIEILQHMDALKDHDFWSSVSAASYACKKMIRTAYPYAKRPMARYRQENNYPELDAHESEFLRHTVSGGITYAPSRWQFKDIKQSVKHIDAHNMHPSSAYLNYFPYGKGEYFEGRAPSKNGFWMCAHHIRISYTSVKLHSVIQLIGCDMIDDYELWVWDFEIPTMKKCYNDLKIEYIDGYAYHKRKLPWRNFYKNNYDQRLIAKKNKDLFYIFFYKLLNNASYGKLLEHGHQFILKNIITEDGFIDSEPIEKENYDINGTYTYIPVGSCIPAYSRVCLVETALKIDPTAEHIVYFDTDSIFFIETPETMANASKLDFRDHLGGWGWEPDITRAQFTAPKRYKEAIIIGEGKGFLLIKDDIKAGGITLTGHETYEDTNLIDGDNFMSHSRVRVQGGTIIVDKPKRMKVQPKYMANYLNNVV